MTHRHAFKAINRTLRNLIKAIDLLLEEKLFKDKVIIFEGDFHQILLVVIKESHKDIIESCL